MDNWTLVPLSVRVEGLEPPCLAASDPKSDASANFATPAIAFPERPRFRVLPVIRFVQNGCKCIVFATQVKTLCDFYPWRYAPDGIER